MKRVAIIVGHANSNKGAISPHGIPSEFDFNSEVAKHLTDIADVYYYDSYKGGYKSMVDRLFNHINKHNYAITIELHYNSYTPSVHGTEVLYYTSSRLGKLYASELSEMISNEFGTFNRGAKGRKTSDRGGYALYAGKSPAVLLEPFFATNKEDVERFKGQEEKYANVIRKFISGKTF